MPRLTSEELREAKRLKAEERRGQEAAEEFRLTEEDRQEGERAAREVELQEKHSQLESFVNGIYDEIAKLSIKWPTQPVSTLTLKKTNRAICSARELFAVENDQYLDEINVLIPAGDNPEARDVVMALRQVKDALARMAKRHSLAWRGY